MLGKPIRRVLLHLRGDRVAGRVAVGGVSQARVVALAVQPGVEAGDEKAAPGEPVAETQAILLAAAEAGDEKDRRTALRLIRRQAEDRNIMDDGRAKGNRHLFAAPK